MRGQIIITPGQIMTIAGDFCERADHNNSRANYDL
jgi:hypothetical protein